MFYLGSDILYTKIILLMDRKKFNYGHTDRKKEENEKLDLIT